MMRRTNQELAKGFPVQSTRTLAQIATDQERETIARVIVKLSGNVSAAAQELGVTRRGLYLKMRRLGIDHTETVSRQLQWKRLRVSQGLCGQCGNEPLLTRTLGARCHRKHTKANRRQGHQPWQPGKRGRPPLSTRTSGNVRTLPSMKSEKGN